MQEVAIIERLQTQILELHVAFGPNGLGNPFEIEPLKLGVEHIGFDAGFDIGREILGIPGGHIGLGSHLGTAKDKAQRLMTELVEQQPGAHLRIAGLALDQRPCGKDRCESEFIERDPVIKIAAGFLENCCWGGSQKPVTCFGNHSFETREIERHRIAFGIAHGKAGFGCDEFGFFRRFLGPLGGAPFAIQHIGARHLVVLGSHQRQFHLVLDVLDVEGSSFRRPPRQSGYDFCGQSFDDLVNAARSGGRIAFDGDECLGQRDRNLGGIEGAERAIALDEAVTRLGALARTRGQEIGLIDRKDLRHRHPGCS